VAVDGLLSGLGGAVVMAAYLWVGGIVSGLAPGTLFDHLTGETPSTLTQLLTHLAVGAVYGALFALAYRLVRRLWKSGPLWPVAGAYGVLLWLAAEILLLPGTGSPLPTVAQAHFAVAHLLYGLVLGLLLTRTGFGSE
ncbi:MAG: hypothetical protein ACRDIB_10770, partial [Ardenticatenaceae bacterium]